MILYKDTASRLTAKGASVFFLHFMMWSFKISGYIEPEPIIPKPPALLTALANFQTNTPYHSCLYYRIFYIE